MREKTDTARQTTGVAFGEARKVSIWAALFGRHSIKTYGISLAVAILLAATGGFNNGDAPLWVRLAYWIPIMCVGGALGTLTSTFIVRIERWAQSQFLSWGLLTVLVGLPMSLVVWVATALSWSHALTLSLLMEATPGVFLISGVMAAIFTLLHQAPIETHAHPEKDAEPPRFLDRLPLKLRGAQIYAVSAEDHYLRLHTSRGNDMILMRLTDAITELDGIEGGQVHRSWWVAREAIERVSRGEGKAVFHLKGGVEAPVSRTYAKALREAGWY